MSILQWVILWFWIQVPIICICWMNHNRDLWLVLNGILIGGTMFLWLTGELIIHWDALGEL